MARKPKNADTSTFLDALADVYVKLIPIDERKKRILANAGHCGVDVKQLDNEAFAQATRTLTAPRTTKPDDLPRGLEGTPMGSILNDAA